MRLFTIMLAVISLPSAPAWSSVQQEGTSEPDGQAVLAGLDPVLLTRGQESQGLETITVEHDGYLYAFASQENRKAFTREPSKYEIQFRGACASMAHSGAPPKSGDAARFWVHGGRIYIFASDTCREDFKADPDRYANPQDGRPRG